LYLDVDAGLGKPYADARAAFQDCERFRTELDLPQPTYVASGNGVHPYWVLDTDLEPELWLRYAQSLKAACLAHNLHAGAERTADSASILRPPGTHHRKTEPKLVKVGPLAGPYQLEQFAGLLKYATQTRPPAATNRPRLAGNVGNVFDETPRSADRIRLSCGQLDNLQKSRGLIAEPLRHACFGVLAFCEDGFEVALENNQRKRHEAYTADEIEDKFRRLNNLSGATTCARFHELNPQVCEACPHWQKINSPISLSRERSEPRPDAVPGRAVDAGTRVSPQSGNAELDAEIGRLSTLAPAQYEHERKEIADRFKIRTTVLDRLVTAVRGNGPDERQGHALDLRPPEPWPEPVDGAELLDDITAAIKRYVVIAEHAARACALWCLHTYLLDCFLISPRLAIRSATHRCGKTTLLDIISYLALRTLSSANVTAASVFRVIEACRPTLLIDEADTFLPESDELRGVINSGHRKGGTVIRTVGDDHEPRKFSTYSATAIALIGRLPATLHDRSAPVVDLKRRLRTEHVESFRLDRTAHLDVLARKAARWATDKAEQIRDTDPELPAGLFNRDGDNWRPLLAIAEAAGGKWPEQAREAAALCCAVTGVEDASQLELLLGDIRDVFVTKQADEITSAVLVDGLVAIEGHPWAEMGKSRKPLTQNRLARMLNQLRISPEKVGPEEKRLQGYKRERFKEAFARYLPVGETSKVDIRTEPHETGTSEHFQSGQPDPAVQFEKCEKSSNDGPLSTCPVAKRAAGERMLPYEVLGPALPGQRCTLCGKGGGVERIRHRGRVNLWHPACADRLLAALHDPPVKVPDLPPDPPR
jgi:putative DNA primase/helicase